MRKITLLTKIVFLTFLLNSTLIFAQETKPEPATDTIKKENKLKFGCGFGLNFVGGTSLSLSPNLTYKVSDKISLGGGLQGSYNAIKNLQNTTTFGANVLAFYNPIKKLQTTLEFAQLRVKTTNESSGTDVTKTFWDSALFAGLGYNVTSKISLGAKYNFLYKEDESVYSSPVIPFVNITF